MSDCEDEQSEITVYRSGKAEYVWIMPFWHEKKITERAVCRAWIGFTELSCKEANVYITPNGEVYHLYRDCTHLDLSIGQVTYEKAKTTKNTAFIAIKYSCFLRSINFQIYQKV